MRTLQCWVVTLFCISLVTLEPTAIPAQVGGASDAGRPLSDVFRAGTGDGGPMGGRARVAANNLSLTEADYARVYQAFRGVQESRTAVPADPQKRLQYIKGIRARMAIPDDAVPGVKFLLMWNHVALDATAMDHNTLSGSFGEQFGPTRASRSLAIVHLAMFEAVNAISRKHPSYQKVQETILAHVGLPVDQVLPATASIDRAIVEAGYRTLIALYPEKADFLVGAYQNDRTLLGDVPNAGGQRPPKMILGEHVGAEAAEVILAKRRSDRSEFKDPPSNIYNSNDPEVWQQDPISKLAPALGGNWPRVKPFLIASGDAFRPGTTNVPVTPPAYDSPEFIAAYKEVKRLGGDPNALISEDRWPTPTERTGWENPSEPNPADNSNQTFVGVFWGYDGTALLCAPPRLYNMIATSVALNEKKIGNVEDFSQYLALINLAMADAGIAAWDAKYHFLFPRPVTYLRNADVDQTPEGTRNIRWTPLGAPVTNGTAEGRNLTPPFPSYPSGHATFGGAVFQSMTLYFKKLDPAFPDKGIAFDFVSDEYNGMNRGPGEEGARKRVVAHFDSFVDAQTLNARSRIYLGIHWQFDADHGILQGNKVAEDVYKKFVQP